MSTLLKWADFAPNGEAFHVASYDLEDGDQPTLHTHDYAEIFWVNDGEGIHIGETEKIVIPKGSLCIVHPEVIHRFGSRSRMTLLNVGFPASVYASLVHIYDSVQLTHSTAIPACFSVSENGLIELNRALNELVTSPNEPAYLWRFIARCMCVLSGRQDWLAADAPEWLRHACQQIRQPEHAKIGVEAFVRLAGRSPEHVSRFTRKWTGMAPRDLVQQARLTLVARELALTDKPILEITLDAGFENLGHCYKLFKEKYGMPPAEYRKSQKRLPAGIML